MLGAWGTGPLENDDAADWIAQATAAPGWAAARDVLERVANGNEYVEAPDASIAVAAAALVAAAITHDPSGLVMSAEAASWATAQASPDDGLRGLARTAVDRVVRESELRDLWVDSQEYEAWSSVTMGIAAQVV